MTKTLADYKTEGGFDVRIEMRLKNASLVNAREQLGLNAKEVAGLIGISYQTL